MDLFFNILRKFLVGTIAVVFAFVVTYVPQQYNQPKQVEAAFPVIDAAAVALLTTLTGTAVAEQTRESLLDSIAWAIAKAMVSSLVGSLVTWINSGFQGSPAFIQDLQQTLLDIADEAVGEFIRSLGELGSFICSPFRLDLQLALSLEYQKARERKKTDSCTLSGIVDNVEDFYQGEIAQGKFWEQWLEITSKPKTYTPYGQLLEARAEMELRIINSKGQVLTESSWGNGFLSGKICEVIEGPAGPKKKCSITKPGQVIASSLNKALGAGQDQLIAADEINEIVSALIGQIANQALLGAAGLLGLTVQGGGSGYGGNSGNSYVDSMIDQSQPNGTYAQQGFAQMEEKLEVQIEYRDLAISYIPQLQAASTNIRFTDEQRAEARAGYEDALYIRDTTIEHISTLTPLITQYRALAAEHVNATVERKREINQEQADILSRGIQYRAYTDDRLRLSRREWSSLVNP